MSVRDEAAAAKPTVYLRDWKKAAQKEHDDLIELRIKTAKEDEIVALPNFIDGYGAGLRAGWDAGREEAQKRIKDLDEAASELLTGWDSLVAANAELQRRIDAALTHLKTARMLSNPELKDEAVKVAIAALTTEEQER